MSSDKKPRADAKLKNLPEADQEALWLWLHPRDPDAKVMTLEEAQAEVPLRWGFTVSLSSLSEWRSWYALQARTNNAMARAQQARLEWLKENPDATPDELEQLGQMVFTAESIEGGNIKGFVALMRERSRRKALALDLRKIEMLETAARDAKAKLEAVTEKAKAKGGLSEETLREIEEAAKLL